MLDQLSTNKQKLTSTIFPTSASFPIFTLWGTANQQKGKKNGTASLTSLQMPANSMLM